MDAYRKLDPERLREQEEQSAEERRLRELEQDAAEEKRRREREEAAAEEERLRAVEEERQRRELAWESRRRIREDEAEAEWRQRDMVPADWKSTRTVALLLACLILAGAVVAAFIMWPGWTVSIALIVGLMGLVGHYSPPNGGDPP